MKTIPLSQIQIRNDRQRRYFDESKHFELQSSIADRGLMHALVLRELPGGALELVAGERRYKAIGDLWAMGGRVRFDGQDVPPGEAPYVTLGELPELEAEEAQLDENLRRDNLTWQEHAAAVARLERLRRRQAEQSGSPLPSVATLAAEVHQPKRGGEFTDGATGYGKDQVRKELVVAKYLDRPTVRAAKSVDEAFKIVKREEELARAKELGAAVGATFAASDHLLILGNALDVVPGLEPVFDVILTDPPYGMGADDFGDSAGRNLPGESIHLYKDDENVIAEVVLPVLEAAAAKCRPAAHAYVFCDIDGFHRLRSFFESLGWRPFRTPLIWAKPDGRVPLPEHGPRRTYELLLYAFRGSKPVRKVASDILEFGPDVNLNMAAQKPVGLYRELLERSCLPGDSVLDPFAGTGTILPAAHGLKVRATAVELNPTTYGIAAQRLKDLDP